MRRCILVVDDEKDIVELVQYNLEKEGYEVLTAQNGQRALEQAGKNPDLILLDVMMPELDGWEVVKRLKRNERTASIPVVFLTAKTTEIDEVLGLELGAEDFLVKPITIPKLMARIKSVFRRLDEKLEAPEERKVVRFSSLEINPLTYKVKLKGKEISFPRKEFEILYYLAQNAGRVVTRETILRKIWGDDVLVVDRTVDVHIRRIREKLENFGDSIETVRGVGYRFKE